MISNQKLAKCNVNLRSDLYQANENKIAQKGFRSPWALFQVVEPLCFTRNRLNKLIYTVAILKLLL